MNPLRIALAATIGVTVAVALVYYVRRKREVNNKSVKMDTPKVEGSTSQTPKPEVEEKAPAPAPAKVEAQQAPDATNKETQEGKKKEKGKNTNTGKAGRKTAKGMVEIEPPSGTRDFYPDEMRLRTWLFEHFRAVARSFAFQEYDAPVLESEDLYVRKAGEEITEQMYNFIDKEKKKVALRPEMTPSLARMILRKGGPTNLLMPLRWFSIPQCWRFENVMRGRKREHYQWNMDIIGVNSITAEAELLAAIVSFFKRLGLTSKDVVIKVNSRKVLQDVLTPLGITAELFAPVCVIVDKLDKLTAEEVTKQLTDLKLEASVIEKIKETLTIKDLDELKKKLPENSVVVQDLTLLWDLAKAYDFDDWIIFDASIVRGLAYYTGIVFEAKDRKGELRAICGGGRYDKLLSTYGSKQDVPMAGFGFGDCVIVELLKEKNLLPDLSPQIDDLIICFDESLRTVGCKVANKLRSAGRRVDLQLIPKKKVTWCFEYADRIGAQRAVFVAPDEWARGEVRIKNLRETDPTKKEVNVPFESL